jgi:hypothetical protein
VLLAAVVPFTLIRMKPVNDRLLAPELDADGHEVACPLRAWGRLHWVPSVTSALSFLTFLAAPTST